MKKEKSFNWVSVLYFPFLMFSFILGCLIVGTSVSVIAIFSVIVGYLVIPVTHFALNLLKCAIQLICIILLGGVVGVSFLLLYLVEILFAIILYGFNFLIGMERAMIKLCLRIPIFNTLVEKPSRYVDQRLETMQLMSDNLVDGFIKYVDNLANFVNSFPCKFRCMINSVNSRD